MNSLLRLTWCGLLTVPAGLLISMNPANAGSATSASVSGAVSYTTPAGYSTSISAEKVAPAGYTFNGTLTVTAVVSANGTPQSLLVDGGVATATAAAPTGSTIQGAVIQKLGNIDTTTQAGLDAYSAILKAAAGANGLE